ncbi:hypothetical protein [Vitiosangium sp. GDMCC 1.1324]|uniref:hypothetical protein n=1 Tax=Vitiosangium sp. (strain GDMCC 1.1324) TaxID=2138576 RepID=UPI000D367D89|nr:hypothetical protein [Vitiosangium sp. GDMCC 1.1324]PTL79079.1 hypothetical protein DAT35_36330 [Vitiosangium sp. GDMCC 1.1324]
MTCLPWFKLFSDFSEHPKTLALQAELEHPEADAFVLRMWCYLAKAAPTGSLTGRHAGVVLERAIRWTGQPGRFVEAALAVGFLEQEGENLVAHHWAEVQGAHVAKVERDRKKPDGKKASRQPPAMSPQDSRAAPPNIPRGRMEEPARDVRGESREKRVERETEDPPLPPKGVGETPTDPHHSHPVPAAVDGEARMAALDLVPAPRRLRAAGTTPTTSPPAELPRAEPSPAVAEARDAGGMLAFESGPSTSGGLTVPDVVDAVHREVMQGRPYPWDPKQDDKASTALLSLCMAEKLPMARVPEEVGRRFGRALVRSLDRYAKGSSKAVTLRELARRECWAANAEPPEREQEERDPLSGTLRVRSVVLEPWDAVAESLSARGAQ